MKKNWNNYHTNMKRSKAKTKAARFWVFTMLATIGGLFLYGSVGAYDMGDIGTLRFFIQALCCLFLMVWAAFKMTKNSNYKG